MDNLWQVKLLDLDKILEDKDQLCSIWNSLFQKFLQLDNKVISYNDKNIPDKIEKQKDLINVNVKINLEFEITGSVNHWYKWNIQISDKDWNELFTINSHEPVYWLAHKDNDIVKSPKHSVVKHVWDYYKITVNHDNLKNFFLYNETEKQNELNILLNRF